MPGDASKPEWEEERSAVSANYSQTTTYHCTVQCSQNTPQLHSDDHTSLHFAVEPKYTRITLRRPHITALRTVQSTLWGILVAVQCPVRADWCSDIWSECKLMDFCSSAWTHAPVHHAWQPKIHKHYTQTR